MEDNYKTSAVTEKDALRAELETVGPTDAGIAAEDYENFKTMAQPFTEKILKNIQVRKSFCFGFAIIAKVIGDKKKIYIYILKLIIIYTFLNYFCPDNFLLQVSK